MLLAYLPYLTYSCMLSYKQFVVEINPRKGLSRTTTLQERCFNADVNCCILTCIILVRTHCMRIAGVTPCRIKAFILDGWIKRWNRILEQTVNPLVHQLQPGIGS